MFRFLLLFVLLLPAGVAVSAAAPHADKAEKALTPRYKHWLTEEVPYIIESDEKAQFLALHTDAERDSFITAFWAGYALQGYDRPAKKTRLRSWSRCLDEVTEGISPHKPTLGFLMLRIAPG